MRWDDLTAETEKHRYSGRALLEPLDGGEERLWFNLAINEKSEYAGYSCLYRQASTRFAGLRKRDVHRGGCRLLVAAIH